MTKSLWAHRIIETLAGSKLASDYAIIASYTKPKLKLLLTCKMQVMLFFLAILFKNKFFHLGFDNFCFSEMN